MANRRMFSREIVCTDAFLDMPASTQALYFQFGMAADDDGFVSSPKKIATLSNCGTDDIKLLAAKGFIIPFQSGICVITHWRQNNELKSDRYHETIHLAEKHQLEITDCSSRGAGGRYRIVENMETECFQDVSTMETQYSIGKNSKEKNSKVSMADKPQRASRFTPPSVEEVKEYCRERGNNVNAQRFVDFYTAKGWKIGKDTMKDWKAAVRTWEKKDGSNDIRTPDKYYYTEDQSL